MKKILLALLLSCGLLLSAQTTPQPTATPSPTPQSDPQAQPSGTPNPNRVEVEPIEEKDHKISPAEAKELFESVDEILRFASTDTGLPIRRRSSGPSSAVKRSRNILETSLKTMLTVSALSALSWCRKSLDCCRAVSILAYLPDQIAGGAGGRLLRREDPHHEPARLECSGHAEAGDCP